MKTLTRYSILLGLLACSALMMRAADPDETPDPNGPNCEDCASPLFMLRPQGLNSAAIFNPFYFGCCDSSLDASFMFTLGYRYEQTFDSKHIARCLFGSQTVAFAGHNALTTAPDDVSYVQAENFGLSPDFLGTITFDPQVQNHNIDFTSRFEFGSVWDNLEGVYCMVNATLTNSRWNLRATETLDTTATITTQPACLNSVAEIPAFTTIETALEQITSFGQLPAGPAPYGRFVFNQAQAKTALANIDVILGYDFQKCDGYHFGIFLKTVAPTGNRPDPKTVFAPIVGNGHHWEFGGGADGHWDIWTCDNQCITAYIYGNITHLFDDKQWRTFKLFDPDTNRSCCWSQYTLLKEFNNNAAAPVFQNQLIRATDFTTRYVDSSFNVQGDATLRFVYTANGLALGLGYNVYGRSAEDIQFLDDTFNQQIDMKQHGIKGDTGVCVKCASTLPPTTPSLNATMNSTCVSNAAGIAAADVDNPEDSFPLCSSWDNQPSPQSSNPAKILDPETNIYFKNVPRQVTSKLFGTIDYQWQHCDLTPFIGGGVEVEFPFSGDCYVCTPSQWGVWIHGGLEF